MCKQAIKQAIENFFFYVANFIRMYAALS